MVSTELDRAMVFTLTVAAMRGAGESELLELKEGIRSAGPSELALRFARNELTEADRSDDAVRAASELIHPL